MNELLKLAAERRKSIIEIRRRIHMYPEPGFKEFETAGTIQSELDRLQIPYTVVPPTGVVAAVEGERPGQTVALRADMDALELEEEAGHGYASRNPGLCHACGHDAHVAMLLGAAGILSERKSRLAGTVRLIFQPAEESFGGARTVVGAGGLEGASAIFGMHILGRLPAGMAAVASGPVMAAANHFQIRVKGRGGHGGMPHEGADAAVAAASVVMNLQSLVSREINPLETAVISIGRLHAGTAYNILAASAEMEGTTRCFTETVNSALEEKMERIVRHTALACGAEAEMTYTRSVPPTVNDPGLTAIAETSIDRICGPEKRVQMSPVTGAEDFAFYLEKVPGVFVFLGGGNEQKNLLYPQHHPSFDIEEDALEVGAALYACLALDFLKAKQSK
jgi:amidohydrolase